MQSRLTCCSATMVSRTRFASCVESFQCNCLINFSVEVVMSKKRRMLLTTCCLLALLANGVGAFGQKQAQEKMPPPPPEGEMQTRIVLAPAQAPNGEPPMRIMPDRPVEPAGFAII